MSWYELNNRPDWWRYRWPLVPGELLEVTTLTAKGDISVTIMTRAPA